MSAESDGPSWASYVEYGGVRFPIDPGGGVQRQPQQPYPPATQLGPSDRPPLDQRLAALTFADTSLGIGMLDLNEQQGVTTVWWSTLETRYKGRVALPPQPRILVTPSAALMGGAAGPGAAFPASRPVHALIFRSSTRKMLFTYGPGTNTVLSYDLSVTPPTVLAWGLSLTHLVQFRDNLVGVGPAGTTTVSNALVATNRGGTAKAGLCLHDNKLWSFDLATARLVWTVDPTAGWNQIGDQLWLADGETIGCMIDFRDKTGAPAVHLVTTRRVVGYEEEPGEWREVWPYLWELAETPYPWLTMWSRDEQMYLVMPGDPALAASRYVMQFTGSTDMVGPGKSADFPFYQMGSTLHVQGNIHNLYCWCGQWGTSDGAVLAFNEAGGWHCLYQPTQAAPPPVPPGAWDLPSKLTPAAPNTHGAVVGGTCYGGTVYIIHADGSLLALEDRDDMIVPPYRVGGTVDTRPRDIWWPETDCGLANAWKSGAYLYLDMRLPDNSPGMQPGSQLEVFYTADGAPWFRLPFGLPLASHPVGLLTTLSTTGGPTSWPLLIPLPEGDWDHQVGLPFRRIQFAARHQGPGNVPSSTLAELTLYYSRWNPQRYSYQCVIDLSKERFPEAESLFEGRSVGELRALLLAFATAKVRAPLRFGHNEFATFIPAADCFLGAQEDIMESRGHYQTTFRDLAAYEDA